MPLIEIWDQVAMGAEHSTSTRPALDLRDLLAELPPEQLALNWSILELWAIAQDDSTDVVALEARVDASPTGSQLTGTELVDLSGRMLQVVDAIVVAFTGSPPRRSHSDLRESSEIVIEAIDSSLWRVYARDRAVTDRLRRNFTDVREVLPEVRIPAIHDAQ